MPSATIIDGVGGTETGGLMTTVTGSSDTVDAVTAFVPRPNVTLLDENAARSCRSPRRFRLARRLPPRRERLPRRRR